MYKKKLRSEKNCLNCRYTTTERFCPNCGQENVEPKLPFGDILKETFKQILEIDGRFYKTIKLLFLKSGLVAKEYVSGKRKTYTHPVKLFFVFGALFLLAFNLTVNIEAFAIEEANIVSEIRHYEVGSANYTQMQTLYKQVYGSIFGNMVYIIILSIPIFAFFSKLFFRSKNKYFFVDYMIYAIYNYVVYFILLAILFAFCYLINLYDLKKIQCGLLLFMVVIIPQITMASRQFLGYVKVRFLIAGISQWVLLIISLLISTSIINSALLMIYYPDFK